MAAIDSKDLPVVVLLGLLVLVCLACDFFMVPALAMMPAWAWPIPGIPFLLAIVGCVLAQGCLLAAWLAWSDQPFWQRFTRHWVVTAILYLVWAAGLAVSRPTEFAATSAFVGLSAPLVSMAAQMPLWIARQSFGWRLIRGDRKNDAGIARLSIRDLMAATLLVALALALARIAPSPDGKEIGMIWVFMVVAASAVSNLTLLPASALLLRTTPFHRGVLFAGLYAAFWPGLLWLVNYIGRHYGLFGSPPQPVLVGATWLVASFATTVILAAAVARAGGYRLVSGQVQRRSSGC